MTPTPSILDPQALVDHLNREAFVATLREFNIQIAVKAQHEWRATKRTRGTIAGLDSLGALVIVCTNGVVGWFIDPNGKPLLCHIDHFSGKVGPVYSYKSPPRGDGGERSEHQAERQALTQRLAKAKNTASQILLALKLLGMTEKAPPPEGQPQPNEKPKPKP